MGLISPAQMMVWVMRGIAMLLAIPVHEAAHAFVSDKLGDPTAKNMGRLSLNPMAHFDLLGALCMIFVGVGWAKPVPVYPYRYKNPKAGMAISAAAGPVSNLLLAFITVILYKLVYYFTPDTMVWGLLLNFLMVLASVNVSLAVFNLLPVPPFDGSRIALVLLPRRLYFKVMQYERYIFMVMFVLLMLGVFDLPLALLNNAMWDLLDKATFFIDKAVMAAAYGVAV